MIYRLRQKEALNKSQEAFFVKKLSVCVLFGGISPEHEVSLRSAESVLNHLNKEKYNICLLYTSPSPRDS